MALRTTDLCGLAPLLVLVLACGRGTAEASAQTGSKDAASQIAAVMGSCTPAKGTDLTLFEVARGLQKPVHALAPPGDPRLFIVEQPGRVRILRDGIVDPTPFVDVSDRLTDRGGEQGLLGLAFHPDYPTDPRIFLQYTSRAGGATVVAEHRVDPATPDVASSEGREILRVAQPYANHNAGEIAFSPKDGMLYIGLGDGGAGGDPQGHGRNKQTLLGSLLRVDVTESVRGAEPYAIPPDNPYADGRGGRPEIWATGLRNPWRFSFDVDGSLYLGDVGQNAWEEIDHLPAGVAGVDFGWNTVEGDGHCYLQESCDQEGLTRPVLDYPRTGFCDSVTGGFVYRGACMPDVVGSYWYADYCDDWVRSFVLREGRAEDRVDHTKALDPRGDRIRNVSSFGKDGRGELYVLSHRDGRVFKLVHRSVVGG